MPLAYVVIQGLLAVALLVGAWFACRTKRMAAAVAASGVALGLIDLWLNRRPDLYVALLPYADAIYFDNWLPYGAALFCGAIPHFAKDKAQRIRMGVMLTALFVLTWAPTRDEMRPLAESTENHVDENGIVRQTSRDTCAAAASATFVRLYGVEAGEAEMIQRARTLRGRGTTAVGVYRALRITLAERPDLKPRVLKRPVDWLIERDKPAVIAVGLPRNGSPEAIAFGEKYDWPLNAYHEVVFLGRDKERPGYVLIGEPDFGRESWPEEHLRYLYAGFSVIVE
ncbi:hypothetical protein GC173_04885 [bacterium]|nr:hypothetical protein [bacterium]